MKVPFSKLKVGQTVGLPGDRMRRTQWVKLTKIVHNPKSLHVHWTLHFRHLEAVDLLRGSRGIYMAGRSHKPIAVRSHSLGHSGPIRVKAHLSHKSGHLIRVKSFTRRGRRR